MTSMLQDAKVPVDSILSLASALIKTPSQAGIDDPTRVAAVMTAWLRRRGLAVRVLQREGKTVGQYVELPGKTGGYRLCLNACLDTASVGDVEAWSSPPTEPVEHEGWLYGRGSADSKMGAAIFAHLAKEISTQRERQGTLFVLFDNDEHTGAFGGVKSFVEEVGSLDGAMIGYPGNFGVVTGARGFYRAELTFFGTSAHSGASKPTKDNAIVRGSEFVARLSSLQPPVETDPRFPMGPKATVTEMSGGSGFSVVPDRCRIKVDVRLTPSFDAAWARGWIKNVANAVERSVPSRRPYILEELESWPPYALPEASKLAQALQEAAQTAWGRPIERVICGPSNIGNFLASRGVPATCGFGVTYEAMHAVNERAFVGSIAPVYHAYRTACQRLLS